MRRDYAEADDIRFALEDELGVRVIGGCCGFESHHIKAMAEELAEERGVLPAGSVKSDYGFEIFKRKAVQRPAAPGALLAGHAAPRALLAEAWERTGPAAPGALLADASERAGLAEPWALLSALG